MAESERRHTNVGQEEVGLRMPGGHDYEDEDDGEEDEEEDENLESVEGAQDEWLREQGVVAASTNVDSTGNMAPSTQPPRRSNEARVDGVPNGAPDGGFNGAGLGSLEDALAAYGLTHLWPTMRDEELDCETYAAMEVQYTMCSTLTYLLTA